MVERIATGVRGLDESLGGGVPKSVVTAITGPIGIGKTCLAWQFLKQGLYADEHVLFMTSKDSPELLLQTASSLGYDLDWALDQERLFILDWRNVLPEGVMVPELVKNFLDRIQTLIVEHNIKRLVFDPLLPFDFMDPSMSARFYKAIKSQLAERCPGVSIWVLLMEPFPRELKSVLPFDTWIQLGWNDTESRRRSLRIQKMPCTEVSPHALTFDIIKGEGIVITS
jgi:circadian clock protein KaiC